MKIGKSIRVIALSATVVAVAASLPATALAGPTAKAAAPSIARHSIDVPAAVRQGDARMVGRLPGKQKLRLTLGLTPPHQAEEEQFLAAVQTKGSAEYHHFLTPAQYIAKYDPSVADEAAVVSWAQSAGLKVTQRFPDRLLVDVQGSVKKVSKAFGVTLHSYKFNGETDFSNSQPPTIPPALTGVLDNVEGLDNIQRMTPDTITNTPHHGTAKIFSRGAPVATVASSHGNAPQRSPKAAKAALPNLTNGAIDPNDLNSSQGYDFGALYRQGHCCNPTGNSGSSPKQTSIDLMGFGTVNYNDTATFAGKFGLAYNIAGYNIDGTPPTDNDDDNAEDTLDIEYAMATSNSYGAYQNTAKITEYYVANFNASTFADAWNSMYTHDDARTASASFGGEEGYAISSADMDTNHNILNNMVGTGWSLFASSGDHGSYGDCAHLGVQYPASDSDMIAVGGTRLSLDSSGNYSSEVAWSPDGACDHNGYGSGGGCSSHFPAPSWQGSSYPCGSGSRADPDISLNSDGATAQYVYFNGGAAYYGGTSIAAPEMAGFSAQADSYLTALGDATAGNFASTIWTEGRNSSAPHNPFYDTTSGCNYTSGQSGYCAGSGYDLVTGWGSANMLQLAWALNWFKNGDSGRPTVTFGGPAAGFWYNTNQNVTWTVADTGGGSTPTGVAGFTQAWDTPATDPSGEAHGGGGNSYYSGPEFPNATSGYLSLASAGTGCHIAYVTAWDNMGYSSGSQLRGYLCYDPYTPSGTISINSGAAQTSSSSVTLNLSAASVVSNDPITYMRFSTDGSTYGSWQTYSTSASYTLPAGDGTKRVYVQYENSAGSVSSAVSDTIVVDSQAPVITSAPNPTLAQTPLTSGTPHLKVTWAGTDAGTGITKYVLQESVDSAAYTNVTLPSPTATTVMVATPPGHTYQFKVQATDNSGHTSAFQFGAKRTLKIATETAASITYSAGWSRVALSGASGGFVDKDTVAGRTAKFTFNGVGIAWVTTGGPTYGKATVSVDGGAATTIQNNRTANALAIVPYVKGVAAGSHSILITNAGTGTTNRTDVDAFLILS